MQKIDTSCDWVYPVNIINEDQLIIHYRFDWLSIYDFIYMTSDMFIIHY